MKNLRVLSLAVAIVVLPLASALGAVICVPSSFDGSCASSQATIAAAVVAAAGGDTVWVAPGTYTEQIIVNKQLILRGAQFGTDARGRVAGVSPSPATETVLNYGLGRIVELQLGSAQSVIDGFAFAPTTAQRGIESTSGPLDNLDILNNHFQGCSSAVFLNDNGVDVDVAQNVFKSSTGTQVHLDQDNFDGLHFTNNWVQSGAGTGLFVDGNHNVGVSSTPRSPEISGNTFSANVTGANLGSRAFEYGTISGNTISNNLGPGLQGGIQHSTISGNSFLSNGNNPSYAPRGGLELTSFGNTAVDRGAQNTAITSNYFSGNARGVVFSGTQANDTISTNTFSCNAVIGNATGAYLGASTNADIIAGENNWWGCNAGPGNAGCDSVVIDGASNNSMDFDPWIVMAVTAAPPILVFPPGGTVTISADFTTNSDGAAAPCTVPDGTPVTFAGGSCGTVDPVAASTSGGVATTTFTASCGSGTASDITAQAGGEAVPVDPPLEFQTLEAVPAVSPAGLAVLALLLGVLAAVVLGRRLAF